MTGTTIAVMQPYFFPYAGYFRLLAAADVFVIYDCVQFPRRGRVHRCEVTGQSGETEWLTLPLAHQPRDVLIRDLAFSGNARAELDRRIARLPWLASGGGPMAQEVKGFLGGDLGRAADFISDGVLLAAGLLGLGCPVIRSSSLGIPPDIAGQDRIIAITRALRGSRYVNAPGGRDLYDRHAFAAHGLELCFLPAFHGRHRSILPQLVSEDADAIRAEILTQTRFEPA